MMRPAIRLARTLALPAIAGGLLISSALPLQAETTAPVEANAPPSAQPSPEEDGAEARAKLNEQQAEFASGQLQQNVNAQSEYERKLAEVEAAKAKIAADAAAAQAAYEAQLKAYNDAKAKAEQDYAAAQAQWEADVAACEAGDRSRCAPPPPDAS